jgi:hypothetical protein
MKICIQMQEKKHKKTIKTRGGRVALVVCEDLQVSQIADLHG